MREGRWGIVQFPRGLRILIKIVYAGVLCLSCTGELVLPKKSKGSESAFQTEYGSKHPTKTSKVTHKTECETFVKCSNIWTFNLSLNPKTKSQRILRLSRLLRIRQHHEVLSRTSLSLTSAYRSWVCIIAYLNPP